MNTPDLAPARTALAEAEQQVTRMGDQWPTVWDQLDGFRKQPPVPWPKWCLLPMAAASSVANSAPSRIGNDTIARMSALNAWRYTRSVYMVEPHLMSRLLTQVPDQIGLDDLVGLPEWCIALTSPERPGVNMWMHLEYDVNTGRPELRLLLELSTPLVVPVYLDRGSTTEALADMGATTLASLQGPGADVHGGELDSTTASYAEHIDGYLAVAAYLARPEADIVHATQPGVRPVKPKRPKKDTDIWLVGYRSAPTA